MSQTTHLPDPQWTDGPQECIGCGYSLAGLAVPGVCPECGAPYDAQVMVLHGTPRSSAGTPIWRRVLWIILIVLGALFSQTWVILLQFAWVLVVLVMGVLVAGTVFMFATSKRERRGVERFMFTTAGVARLPAKTDPNRSQLDAVLIPYSNKATLRLDRVSNVWRRLRITAPDSNGLHQPVFDAGVRCPQEHVQRVQETILAAMMGKAPPAPDPLSPPLHPPVAP